MAEAHNLRLIGHTDLAGHGDCMHVNVKDGFAYIGHMGSDRVGTSIVDVADPHSPKLVTQILTPPGTRSHKVQVAGELLLINHERTRAEPNAGRWSAGLAIYDVSSPSRPTKLGFWHTVGTGVHRMTYWHAPYAIVSSTVTGFSDRIFLVMDLSDPALPVVIGRWWPPEMNPAADGHPTVQGGRRWAHHHSLARGDRAYAGWWDAGLYILDISDLSEPRCIASLAFDPRESSNTHTVMPLGERDLLIVTDEAMNERRDGLEKQIRVIDIADETKPRVISTFPVPIGDYISRPGRFGPHNLHEMRPGSFQSSTLIHATYFNAGVRVYDLTDPYDPTEIAYFVPDTPGPKGTQLNDITVDGDGTIYVTDRTGGGLYILQPEFDIEAHRVTMT